MKKHNRAGKFREALKALEESPKIAIDLLVRMGAIYRLLLETEEMKKMAPQALAVWKQTYRLFIQRAYGLIALGALSALPAPPGAEGFKRKLQTKYSQTLKKEYDKISLP